MTTRVERRARRRRRRAALLGLTIAAIGSFVFGAAMGDSGSTARPTAASLLTGEQLAGQRIVIGFNGTHIPGHVRRLIAKGHITGVVLFDDNLPSRDAGRRLISELQGIRRPPHLRDPLLIMIDQEGGEVKRLNGAPTASAKEMGARGAGFSRHQGKLTAANLRNVGVNVDLAPVLDVGRPGGDIASTQRSFGSTAAAVSKTAIPFAAALQAGGVASTAKHFPGFGAARQNTDVAVQKIRLSKKRLRKVDEAPYHPYIDLPGAMVMISSAIYPAFSQKPASLTRSVATGELRNRLGFGGVSVTDALGGAAIRAVGGPASAGVAAVHAGTDLLLYSDPGDGSRAYRALRRKLHAKKFNRGAFETSVQRVLALRHRLSH